MPETYNPARNLARAVHEALANDIRIRLHLGDPPRLYDYAPEDPVYPYLTYGAMRVEDESGDQSPLTSQTLTLHVWSRYGGRGEVFDILGELRRALESDSLTSDAARIICSHVIFSDIFRTSDGRGLHGLIRINFKTEPVDPALEEIA